MDTATEKDWAAINSLLATHPRDAYRAHVECNGCGQGVGVVEWDAEGVKAACERLPNVCRCDRRG